MASIAHLNSQNEPLLQEREMGSLHRFHPSASGGRGRESRYHTSSTHRLFVSVTSATVLLSFFYVVISLEATANAWKHASANVTSRDLLLTPLINAGNISGARRLARVELFPEESYSGFLTVDENCKSHLFFWFFPASNTFFLKINDWLKSGNVSAPLILWHGGGPGTSGLFALFQGTGPTLLNDDDNEGSSWTENKFPLTRNRSVLYLDSPVGTGFSYSEVGEVCYANSSDDVAVGAVVALRQFYQLFPEYVENELYISSSSYGGKFLPLIAWRIENDNQLDELSGDHNLTSINLKGLISISGFSDPLHQIDYGEFYHNMGLIDGVQLKYFLAQESLAKSLIRNRKYFEAFEIIDPLILGRRGEASYLKNITGIHLPYNMAADLTTENATLKMYRQDTFLNHDWVQQAIHVDGRKFKTGSDGVYNNLVSDLYKSVASTLEDLLNLGKYKFLFTSGQFDLIVPHTTVSKFLHELRWDSRWNFRKEGSSWYECGGKVIGYEKSLDNLTYVMLRNSGHHPFIDAPKCMLGMILNFTE